MSKEEEELILKPFYETAEKDELIEVAEINKAYQGKVNHKVGEKQIYRVLHRDGYITVLDALRIQIIWNNIYTY